MKSLIAAALLILASTAHALSVPTIGGGPAVVTGGQVTASGVTVSNSLSVLAGSTMTYQTSSTTSGSTITVVSYPIVSGDWGPVVSTFPGLGGINGATFNVNITTDARWRLHIDETEVTSSTGEIRVQFNGDAANYGFTMNNSRGSGPYSGSSSKGCYVKANGQSTANEQNINQTESWDIVLIPLRNKVGNIYAQVDGTNHESPNTGADRVNRWFGSCQYAGSAPITSIRIESDKGAMLFTGEISLQRMGR